MNKMHLILNHVIALYPIFCNHAQRYVKFLYLSPAQMVELVDTPDLGSGAARCGGSSPLLGKKKGLSRGLFCLDTSV